MLTFSICMLETALILGILAVWYLFVFEGKPSKVAVFMATVIAAASIFAVCLFGYRFIKQHNSEKEIAPVVAAPIPDNSDECYNDLVNLAQCLRPLKQSALAKGECDADALRIRVEKMLEVKNGQRKVEK